MALGWLLTHYMRMVWIIHCMWITYTFKVEAHLLWLSQLSQ